MVINPTATQMLQSYKTIEQKVEYILEKHPTTRGDDTLLIFRFLKEFYPQVTLKFKDFKALLTIPAFDSIRRARQALTSLEGGKRQDLRPTKRVQKKRERKRQALRNYFGLRNATLDEY